MDLQSAKNFIFSYGKVAKRLATKTHEVRKAEKIVEEIYGDFNPKLVSLFEKIVNFSFRKLYQNIELKNPYEHDFEELAHKYHVILVPNHQSHADYIAMTYLFFRHFHLPIHTAAGANLNFFPMGWVFKNSGAFFIRRTFQRDILYKLVFEGFVAYLLKEQKIIEFFFEGGRSRTGKLLSPRFGLFQMLLEAHQELKSPKPLFFLPTAIAHEQVPEGSAHIKELEGGRKKQEKTWQLFGLTKLLKKRFGNLYVRLGRGIKIEAFEDLKTQTQEIAFKCFRAVGSEMPVTPGSLLACILLNSSQEKFYFKDLLSQAEQFIQYCHSVGIPLAFPAQEPQVLLQETSKLFVNNKLLIKKVDDQGRFFLLRPEARKQLLYLKNTIIHHFLTPSLVKAAWQKVTQKTIKNYDELKLFLLEKRGELKYEFYLPPAKELIDQALLIVNLALNKKLENLQACLELETEELEKVRQMVEPFSQSFHYLYELYSVGGQVLLEIGEQPFSSREFQNRAEALFNYRLSQKKISYPEVLSLPTLNNILQYFLNKKLLQADQGRYYLRSKEKLEKVLQSFEDILKG